VQLTSKQIRIKILPDGTIEAETLGIKGASCKEYIGLLEQLLDAEAVDSVYTAEFYESELTTIEEYSMKIDSELNKDGGS
jgi:hypothetical protein